jgi:hypothetical protein
MIPAALGRRPSWMLPADPKQKSSKLTLDLHQFSEYRTGKAWVEKVSGRHCLRILAARRRYDARLQQYVAF